MHRLVEGVASDGSTIWVSSVLDRQILACTATCRTIATLPQGLHPLGLAWDWGRKILWVAADCADPERTESKCERGALIGMSPAGKLRYRFAPNGIAFHPGDVSATASGIFASDSRNGLVWGLLSARRGGLRAINRPSDGKSAQGTALTESGTEVVVADYARGIGRIDLKSTATTWLRGQDGKPLRGVDGLLRCGNGYFGVYNGDAPGRVLTIRMRADGIEYGELVHGLTLSDPTQIALDGKRLLAVSDSGWEAIGKGSAKRSVGAHIVAIPLSAGCKAD
jgi:DNA-binding beta-propeller fold protein YncE